MDQLQLLAKLIALEMRKTGFPVPENTAPAGSPESPAKTISANDGLSSPRSPLSPLSPGPPPSSPRAPLPGSPKMKKKVVKGIVLNSLMLYSLFPSIAKKSKSSSTGSKPKTKRRPKSRSPEYYYRAELEVKTDQQHQEIREQGLILVLAACSLGVSRRTKEETSRSKEGQGCESQAGSLESCKEIRRFEAQGVEDHEVSRTWSYAWLTSTARRNVV